MLRASKLEWPLLSGVQVVIENEWDWMVFCDIFVNTEYPLGITAVHPDRTVEILDLGANVGYFSLFAANKFRLAGQPFKLNAVEALSSTYRTLRKRTQQVPEIATWHGAVGKRKGEVHITQSANHATSSLLEEKHNAGKDYPRENVQYLDLNKIVTTADIIKCDIEGSEFALLDTYPDLIGRAEMVLMELHSADGKPEEFRERMAKLGFANQKILERMTASVEVFYKPR